MQHILLPDPQERRRLVFYLALEEFVARTFGEGFFVWSVEPTVIFGRNQDMEAEVNLDYCRAHDVAVYRRKSGGGCVYADPGNLMISCIVPGTDVQAAFDGYLQRFSEALRGLGIEAVRTEHNDVLAGSGKVSGNACFVSHGACIVHGTLLYDVDFDALQQAITPSREKLSAKGIRSVRQRVRNLRELGLGMSMQELSDYLADYFTDGSRTLDPAQLRCIEEIEKSYLDPSFLFGKLL